MVERPFHIDFHTHTVYSYDSFNSLDILLRAQKKNFYVAVTDHDTLKGVVAAKKLGIRFIPGIEVTTDRGDVIGLYVDEELKFRRNMDYYEAIDCIHENGGITVAPHPFTLLRMKAMRKEDLALACDMIEGYNSRNMFESANIRAMRLAIENNKPFTAGSDAHFPIELWNAYVDIYDEDVFDNPKVLLRELGRLTLGLRRLRGPQGSLEEARLAAHTTSHAYHFQQTFLLAPSITFLFKNIKKLLGIKKWSD